MTNFTTRNTFLIPSFDLDIKEREKIDRFLYILEKSNVAELFNNICYTSKGGRPAYSDYDLFATVLYGFAFNNPTLRNLEDACKYDLRYIYMMQQNRPGHSIFGNFINEVIVPNNDLIFHNVTNAILQECNIQIEDVFIDGSKYEADANKYKFVWKQTKFHEKLSNKIRTLLSEVNLSDNVPHIGIIDSKLIAQKVSRLSLILDNDNYLKDKYDELCQYLIKALEYEEKERICGPDRNSYYKTDHDATAMTLKSDYYSGLGSNMHAAYNSQLLVAKGIICTYYISQSRSDMNDFIPILKRFNEYYGYYPIRVCADAGYGCLDNYRFLNDNNIENYVKHNSFQGNVSGSNPDRYYLNEDGTLTCLNGNTGFKVDISNRHPSKSGSYFYKVEGCNECPFSIYCKRYMKNKNDNYRIFEVQEELCFYKQKALDNLLSPKGIEMRVNRSSQVEGAIGVIKQDMNYVRNRRTLIDKVKTEHMLTYLGYNIRKLFRYFSGKAKFNYWIAPDNLKAELKRKPSAKRLANKVNTQKKKTNNQKAKDSYKYK